MSSPSRIRFNKTSLEHLSPPTRGKRATYYDTDVLGLQLRITDRGVKSFLSFGAASEEVRSESPSAAFHRSQSNKRVQKRSAIWPISAKALASALDCAMRVWLARRSMTSIGSI